MFDACADSVDSWSLLTYIGAGPTPPKTHELFQPDRIASLASVYVILNFAKHGMPKPLQSLQGGLILHSEVTYVLRLLLLGSGLRVRDRYQVHDDTRLNYQYSPVELESTL